MTDKKRRWFSKDVKLISENSPSWPNIFHSFPSSGLRRSFFGIIASRLSDPNKRRLTRYLPQNGALLVVYRKCLPSILPPPSLYFSALYPISGQFPFLHWRQRARSNPLESLQGNPFMECMHCWDSEKIK